MAKRERRQPEPGEFEDPLSNYEPKEYEDELERSLVEDIVEAVPFDDHLKARSDMTVADAIQLMNDNNFACVVVMDEEHRAVGIFSERDVLVRVADHYEDVKGRRLSDIMTADPVTAYSSDTLARVLNVMVSGGFRHVPVVDQDNKLQGMVGVRKVTAYLQKHFPQNYQI